MEKIKLNQLIDYVKFNYPKDAVEISDGLELFNLALDGLRENINTSLTQSLADKNYLEVREITDISELVAKIQANVSDFSNALYTLTDNDETNVEEDILEEQKNIPDYKEYVVDDSAPHSLYEDYTHKKAKAFSINGKRYEVRDWKDMLMQTCELLVSIDSEKFYSLIDDPVMRGRKNFYFGHEMVETDTGTKNTKMNNLDIYVWTNLSANHIRNLIRKLLKRYGIKISDYYVYLRADYSPLHRQEIITMEDELNQQVDKIGKYVRTMMRDLSYRQHYFSRNELLAMQSKKWSKEQLGLDYPLFKKYQDDTDISEQIKEGSYGRYWKEIFEFNSEKFLVTSQWFETDREKFDKWIQTLEGRRL